MHEVTERAGESSAANDSLRESEQWLRRAMNIKTVGVLFFRLDGRVADANPAFERMSGYTRRELGEMADRAVLTPPEFREATARAASELAETGETAAYEQPMLRKDGSRWWGLFAPTRLAGSGRESECVEFVIDITAAKQTEAALRESEGRLARELAGAEMLQRISTELISEHQPDALYDQLLDAAMALLRSDAGSLQMLDPGGTHLRLLASRGFAPESRAYWQSVDAGSGSSCGQALRGGNRVVVADVEASDLMRGTRDLEEYRRSGLRAVQSTPLVARDGRLIGMMSTHWRRPHEPAEGDFALFDVLARQAADLIERTRAEAALRASEERLRLALAAAQMGTWSWDVSADRHRRDANLNRLLGLEPAETVLPIEEFFRHIHPDDREMVRRAFDASVRQGHNLRAEFRVVWPGGEVRWLQDQGDVFGGPAGRHLAGACVDVTDRRRLEDELRETDRRKDEFLAMLGHELRNPLAPLRNVMETLRRQRLDGDGLARAHAMMERQVGHLTRLVDDLLDVSRITRGLVELRREPVGLTDVVDRAVEMVAPLVDGRGHELSVALPRKPLRVEGDVVRLTQVVFNLLNNAAKYTAPGGRIWVSVEREGDRAVIRVRDNGAGIGLDLVPKVFDLFTQADRTADRSQGGLGLGLTLVRRLVDLHGGKVEARSEGPGRGSEFIVRLTALADEDEMPPPTYGPGRRPAAGRLGRALVVDDNHDVAESLTWVLEGLAEEIKMVHSGPAAIELSGQWRPDLILCDLGMPGMDGYETCRRLRRLPGLESVLIAAVSGYGNADDRRKSKEAGFDRHLVKPIGRATLEELIQSTAASQ